MRFSRSAREQYLSAFNFSSLTDIVMLLLIFFLLTSSFVTTQGLDVTLPETSNSTENQQERVYVSVDESGQISVNDRTTTLAELPSLIASEIAHDSSRVVVLRADQSLALKDVIQVLDEVKGAGARHFFIATEKKK